MDCLDLLLEILETEENVSIIAETDLVLDLLDELVDDKDVKFVEAMEELEETDVLVLSSVGDEIIVEDYFNEDGDVLLVENDTIVIQEGILDEEEFEDYIFADDIYILEIEEELDDDFFCGELEEKEIEEHNEEEKDFLDIVTNDCIAELSKKENCQYCTIREFLEIAFGLGRTDVLSDMQGIVNGKLDELMN